MQLPSMIHCKYAKRALSQHGCRLFMYCHGIFGGLKNHRTNTFVSTLRMIFVAWTRDTAIALSTGSKFFWESPWRWWLSVLGTLFAHPRPQRQDLREVCEWDQLIFCSCSNCLKPMHESWELFANKNSWIPFDCISFCMCWELCVVKKSTQLTSAWVLGFQECQLQQLLNWSHPSLCLLHLMSQPAPVPPAPPAPVPCWWRA